MQSPGSGFAHTDSPAGGKTPANHEVKRIRTLRWMCFISICLTAILCGVGSYFALSTVEQNAAVSQFESITDQSFDIIQKTFDRMELAKHALSKRYSTRYPDLATWPNVSLPEFYEVEEIVRGLTDFDYFSFNPIVYADKLAGFEQYAFDYWDNDPSIPPNMAGYQSWGRGIFERDPTATSTIQITADDKPYTAPVTQVSFISNRVSPRNLGFDAHSDPGFQPMIDGVIECVDSSSTVDTDALVLECIRASIPSVVFPEKFGQQYVAYHVFSAPILVENNSFVGLVAGRFGYDTLLQDVIPDYVSGVDVVITIPSVVGEVTFTYTINDGVPVWKDLGDAHDKQYSQFRNERRMALPAKTVVISLAFYPRATFMNEYTTNIPIYVAISAIALILVCCGIFVVYDYAVRGEFVQKDEALDTKRRYVRYSSHEMRRPLNTAKLGMQVLDMEFDEFIRDMSSSFRDVTIASVEETVSGWAELLKDMLNHSETAIDILNDLLNYDEIEACALRLDFAVVHIYDLIRKTTFSYLLQTERLHIELETEGAMLQRPIDSEVEFDLLKFYVVGDTIRLQQVFRKLMSDALKVTPQHGTLIVTAEVIPDGLPNYKWTPPESTSSNDHAEDGATSVPDDTTVETPYSGQHTNRRAGALQLTIVSQRPQNPPPTTSEDIYGESSHDSSEITGESRYSPPRETSLNRTVPEGVDMTLSELEKNVQEQRDRHGQEIGQKISKGIIEQHGGTISIDRQDPSTMKIVVLLPLFRRELCREEISLRHEADNDGSSLTSITTGNELMTYTATTILLVEKATPSRELLRRMLSSKGYECVIADKGVEAMEAYEAMLAQGKKLDVVVVDDALLDMEGADLVCQLRKRGSSCFVVGLTGDLGPECVNNFNSKGTDAVLPKPLDINTFQSMIANFLPTTITAAATASAAAAPPHPVADKGIHESAVSITLNGPGVSTYERIPNEE